MSETSYKLAVDHDVVEESVERLDAHRNAVSSVQADVDDEEFVGKVIPRYAQDEVALAFVVFINAVLDSVRRTLGMLEAHWSESSLRYQR